MTDWDERFRSGSYPREPDPSPVLTSYVDAAPEGRALDVATGTGRNAVFLAGEGYVVDAVDRSTAALSIAREVAAERGGADRLRPIRADAETYPFPTERYAVVTVSYYRPFGRLPDLAGALVPGGYLFVEGHLRSGDCARTGPSERYRWGQNELLRAGLGLAVVHYDETTEQTDDGRRRANARLLARRPTGATEPYPERRLGR